MMMIVFSSFNNNLLFFCSLLLFGLLLLVHTRTALSLSSQKTKTLKHRNNVHWIKSSTGQIKYPPLLLVGGMAQTRVSWEHHFPSLSRNRHVIIYECLGQGIQSTNDDLYSNVTLPYQAECILNYIENELPTDILKMDMDDNVDNNGDRADVTTTTTVTVDLVGFSFGSRVCMAVAAASCLAPRQQQSSCKKIIKIRKMHLSGIAIDRSDYGILAIQAWKDCLLNDSTLKTFAWSILMATYTSKFLCKQPLDKYIQTICQTNDRDGLLALLNQSEISDKSNPWHVTNMADQIISIGGDESEIIEGKICVGQYDKMSPVESAKELAKKLNWDNITIIPNCGHAVGIEGSRIWNKDVLDFLNN